MKRHRDFDYHFLLQSSIFFFSSVFNKISGLTLARSTSFAFSIASDPGRQACHDKPKSAIILFCLRTLVFPGILHSVGKDKNNLPLTKPGTKW